VSEVTATEILNTLSQVDAIDRELWQQKVIWIQKFVDRLCEVYRKRGLNIPQKPSICDSNDSSADVSVAESTQSKVKELKELKEVPISEDISCPNLNSDVPKKLKSKPIFEHETNPYKLAAKLLEMILVNNPDAQKKTEAQLQSWSRTFDLMIRIDKRKSSQIYDIMFYSQNSEFWRSNILSASKLREQYDKLKMQMEDGRK
jgi:hypothetical protein